MAHVTPVKTMLNADFKIVYLRLKSVDLLTCHETRLIRLLLKYFMHSSRLHQFPNDAELKMQGVILFLCFQ